MVCAAGMAVLEEIETKKLVDGTEQKGRQFFKILDEIKNNHPDKISYILGKGLVGAMIFKNSPKIKNLNIFVSKVCEEAMRRGVLVVHTGRESIKLGPPLTISIEAIEEGLQVLNECISIVENTV